MLVSLVGGHDAASSKQVWNDVDGLPLPGLYLVRMHFDTDGKLGYRAIAANGSKGHLFLEVGAVGSAGPFGYEIPSYGFVRIETRLLFYILVLAKTCLTNAYRL